MQLHPILWISKLFYKFVVPSLNITKSAINEYTAILLISFVVSFILLSFLVKRTTFATKVKNSTLSNILIFIGIIGIYAFKYPFLNLATPFLVSGTQTPIYVFLFNIRILGEIILYIGIFIPLISSSFYNQNNNLINPKKLTFYMLISVGSILLLMQLNFVTRLSSILDVTILQDINSIFIIKWITPLIVSSVITFIIFYKGNILSRIPMTLNIKVYTMGLILSILSILLGQYETSIMFRDSYIQLLGEVLLIVGTVKLFINDDSIKVPNNYEETNTNPQAV